MKRFFIPVVAVAVLAGCQAKPDPLHPEFHAGEGAITGQLLMATADGDKEPLDLKLAGDEGAKALKIELRNVSGVSKSTYPVKEKSRFSFAHVPPGSYEISVYTVVPGKRTIAASAPVTVDPDKVTPVAMTITVSATQN